MKFIFLGIILLTGSLLNAQVISHKVISNGGSFVSNGGYHLASTIGEVSVISCQNSGYFITQGFQQPSMLFEPDLPNPDEGTIISVYPNPVENDLIFKLNIDGITEFTIEIFTFSGISLYVRQLSQLPEGSNYFTIDFSGYSKGIYVVHVYSPEKVISRAFKIEKL